MEVVHFIYNGEQVDFLPSTDNNVMVNATQMAKIFDKRVDVFIKTDHAKAFISALELTPFGGSSTPLKRSEIIKTVNGVNTWMHRILALKFAAWLDPKFEVWVFSTIDQILLGHYREMKEATIEKILAKEQLERKRNELLLKHPEVAELFELEDRINASNRKRVKAIQASIAQIQLDLFRKAN